MNIIKLVILNAYIVPFKILLGKSLSDKPQILGNVTIDKLNLRPIINLPSSLYSFADSPDTDSDDTVPNNANNESISSLPNAMTTPSTLWYNSVHDIQNVPLLPFGQIVHAHIPLSLQTALSGRSQLTYCIGMAPGYKGGILLFNPTTKRCIVRPLKRSDFTRQNLNPISYISI
jgi:hypothetical protein